MLPSTHGLTPYNILTIKDASNPTSIVPCNLRFVLYSKQLPSLWIIQSYSLFCLKIARKLPSLPQLSSSIPPKSKTFLAMVRVLRKLSAIIQRKSHMLTAAGSCPHAQFTIMRPSSIVALIIEECRWDTLRPSENNTKALLISVETTVRNRIRTTRARPLESVCLWP